MTSVVVSRNPLDQDSYERYETDAPAQFFYDYFGGKRPPTLKIYNGNPCAENDVTPKCEADIAALDECEGPLSAIVMPADPGTILLGAVIFGSVAVGVAAAFLLAPPIDAQRGAFNQPSPNNSLGERQNVPRINKRIEDIFGEVVAIPSLIANPYKVFEDNIEKELSYFAIGRGEYDFGVSSPVVGFDVAKVIKDGETPLSSVDGAKFYFYRPGRTPINEFGGASTPTYEYGTITLRPSIAKKSNAINGQDLEAPGSRDIISTNSFDFLSTSKTNGPGIKTDDPSIDFAGSYSVGDSVTISGVSSDVGSSVNVNGTYFVTDVSASYITLNASSWTWGAAEFNDVAGTLSSNESLSVGEFQVGDSGSERLIINYVATNGLQKTDGENQIPLSVDIRVTVSKSGETSETFDVTMTGSGAKRSQVGVTQTIEPTFSGPYGVTIDNLTPTAKEDGFQVFESVQVRDLYALEDQPYDTTDVSTLLVEIPATRVPLSSKKRELNVKVRRKISSYDENGDTGFFNPFYTAKDVMIWCALDERIGGRSAEDIDFQSFQDFEDESKGYFGSEDGLQFNYTFDDDNISFEETIGIIAQSVFAVPYRSGSQIRVNLDAPKSESSMIFNHRNTVPGSERRSVRFGNEKNYDGVEVQYSNSETGQPESMLVPTSGAVNRKKIEAIGVTSKDQAYWIAARAWNGIRYQNTTDEREVLEHANLLTRRDRILLADNTRPDTSDGEIEAQNGLTLTLSQPHEMLSGETYTIWLGPFADQTVESIAITPGSTEYEVILGSAPVASIVTSDADNVNPTKYIITSSTDSRVTAFLVDEVDPQGNEANTVILRCINYDDRYYQNDGDPAP